MKKHFTVDVQLVATGKSCEDRQLAYIGIVNEKEELLLSIYIKPKEDIVSYFTPLTGIHQGDLDKGESLDIAKKQAKEILKDGFIVAQSTRDVINFLDLVKGTDFQDVSI